MKNILRISLIAFCILLAFGYLFSQYKKPESEKVDVQKVQSEPQQEKVIDTIDLLPSEKQEETKDTIPEGMHIMPDGVVMAKDGKEVTDAQILSDGTIRLKNGAIVTPVMDMRAKNATQSSLSAPKQNHVVVVIAGVDFSYDVKQIKVKQGDTVTINFKSNKGFHDWVIDEFASATERVTENDGITSVTFVADEVGTFQYYCSVMNHRQMGMVGYLIVEER
jgi:plastocyanin